MKALLGFVALLAFLCVIKASSHGEAPGTSAMPQSDPTDLYAFVSYEEGRSGYTTIIANYNPRQLPYGGPNFYALDNKFYYNIYVDNTGDGKPELTFQFTITNELANSNQGIALNIDGRNVPVPLKAVGPISKVADPNLNYLEYFRLNVINSTSKTTKAVTQSGKSSVSVFEKPFDNAGTKTFPNSYSTYANQFIYPISIPNCGTGKVFVGQRQESFSINLGKIFDLVNFVPLPLNSIPNNPTVGIAQNNSYNVLRGTNIDSFVLEVPSKCLVGNGNGVIGLWTASGPIPVTSHPKTENRQKARLGNPLINELFTGLKDKDKWNRRSPSQDGDLLRYIFYPTFPQILSVLFRPALVALANSSFGPSIAPLNRPRTDLIAAFLTGVHGINQLSTTPMVEMLRLNTSIKPLSPSKQNFLGVIGGDVAGFPNGRRPGDDIIDIALRVVMGVLCKINLGCTPNEAPVGSLAFTDGAPISASDFQSKFPYLNTPIPGSENVPCSSISFGC